MKLLIKITIISLLFSCSPKKESEQKVESNKNNPKETSSTSQIKPKEEVIMPSNADTSKPLEKWKSLQDVNKKWIKVERDKDGYLIYDPCDGSTPGISIDSGRMKVYWQLEEPTILHFEKFTRTTGNKGLYIWAENKNQTSEFDVKIVDPKRKLVLWKFYIDEKQRSPLTYDNEWIMIPLEYKDEFRKIKLECPTQKMEEIEFLPNEYK